MSYRSAMLKVTARDASQRFSRVRAETELGETVPIAKNGRTVAELRPRSHDPHHDSTWRAACKAMVALMAAPPATGYRVGRITEDDKYSDAP